VSRRVNPTVIQHLRRDLEALLATTYGFVEKSENAASQEESKYWLRRAHDAQRRDRLQDAKGFIERNEDSLLSYFANGTDIDPTQIDPIVTPVVTQQHADLWTYASLTWSVPVSQGYGRRTKFIVRDRFNDKVMAIFALGDPVIGLGARDKEIGWTKEQRHKRLYNIYDAFVLGAVEPYRQLLVGKLAALLAISNETRNYLTNKYTGATTVIRGESKNPTPVLITTSSALGRSSVYNRLTYGHEKAFYSVGYTTGFGHFQISEEMFQQLVLLTQASGKGQVGEFGKGANYRFRVIRHALTELGLPADGLRHGVKREVFLAPVATNWKEFLRGETDTIAPKHMPIEEVSHYFRERWAIPRAQRKPDYLNWKRENMRLSNELPDANIQYSLTDAFGSATLLPERTTRTWSIDDVAVVESPEILPVNGTTISGAQSSGTATVSQLEFEKTRITLHHTKWENGEQDIQAVDRHDSPPNTDSLIRRLRIGIYPSPLHEHLNFMELRVAAPGENGRATVKKLSQSDLERLLGHPLDHYFPRSKRIILGTRAELFRDDSRRRTELCLAYPNTDNQIPVLVWTVTRLFALTHASQHEETSQTKRPRTRNSTMARKRKRRPPGKKSKGSSRAHKKPVVKKRSK
jgi:hypothetical protein